MQITGDVERGMVAFQAQEAQNPQNIGRFRVR